ncbi:MAG: Ger(x)C family spore germination protein [Bacillota bacterium]
MRAKLLLVAVLTGVVLFSSGCWDRVEIEKRGFMVGVGLDVAKSPEEKSRPEETPPSGPIKVTMQLILPGKAARGGGGSGGGAEGQSPFWNLVTISEKGSVLDAIRQTFTRSQREPYLGQMRVVVIGNDMARKGIAGPLDFFFRDPDTRRRIRVLVSHYDAFDVLSVKPRQDTVSGNYLSELAENDTSRIGPTVFLGDVSRFLHEGIPFVLPHVDPGKEEVSMQGAGVFNGQGRLVGWLDMEETKGLRFIVNQIKQVAITVPSPGEEGMIDTVEVYGSKTRIKSYLEGDTVRLVIDIQMEGTLREHTIHGRPLENSYLEELEVKVARDTEKLVRATVKKFQKELRVDALGFSGHLKHRAPWIWRQVGNRWGDLFPSVPVTVKANFNIRRVGTQF